MLPVCKIRDRSRNVFYMVNLQKELEKSTVYFSADTRIHAKTFSNVVMFLTHEKTFSNVVMFLTHGETFSNVVMFLTHGETLDNLQT